MSPGGWLAVALGLLAAACPGPRRTPQGPPPEYEPPRVMPWDSGGGTDPFAEIEGEDVTDDEPGDDAGVDGGDGGDAQVGALEPVARYGGAR